MPALSEETTDDIKNRLQRYLDAIGGYGTPTFLDAGGSAAVFAVDGPTGRRALKAFDPALFSADVDGAERRRLKVQRRLIGHTCPSLIQTYRVDEAEGTAFMEMEYIEWPQLGKKLADIPDSAVVPLINQLVEAVRFLETQDIVHRDIKPENIHVSPDFTRLKLLDLGVAREFDLAEEAALTDHGNKRPFLATAQYSSPEYLFRLDKPSPSLWHGLNFYQVGAVLHDLIMKAPIFEEEMAAGNRWLVARAVLTKTPSFAEPSPNRLASLKALAARCLVKDLNTRLQLVSWEDFLTQGGEDARTNLRGKLAKRNIDAGVSARLVGERRLAFDRSEFEKRITSRVQSDLIDICGTQLPLTVTRSNPGAPPQAVFELSTPEQLGIFCLLHFHWQDEIYERTVNITIRAWLSSGGTWNPPHGVVEKLASSATIDENEDTTTIALSSAISQAVNTGIDLIDSRVGTDVLNDLDLLAQGETQ